jgi:catechol 2,3-dioxygenase
MTATTKDLYGSATTEPALPGSYGEAPSGFRLPDKTRIGGVRLRISSLERSLAYYTDVLGMRVLEQGDGRASLGAQGDERVLVELRERSGTNPAPGRGRLGLYHFALLLPTREALGQFVRHLASTGERAGSADHLVSEAFYLRDPDGLGIEVYADRPSESWSRRGRELLMATDPVDMDSLIRAAGDAQWNGMPAGTVMGHVHLHVGDINEASAFYSEALGFDRTTWSYPGALFLAAGGYHHHIGTNTWAGAGATPMKSDEAGLLEFTIELPDRGSLKAAAVSLSAAGHGVTPDGEDALTSDPWRTVVRLRVV